MVWSKRAAERLPSFAGLKFSSFELDDLIRCVHFDGRRYNVLFGSDEMLLAGLATGAAGAVGSTYNFMAPYYRRVIEALDAGRLQDARQHQLAATRIVHAILEHGGGNAIKAAMGVLGVECGPPRLPLRALGPEEIDALRRGLEASIALAGGGASPR